MYAEMVTAYQIDLMVWYSSVYIFTWHANKG